MSKTTNMHVQAPALGRLSPSLEVGSFQTPQVCVQQHKKQVTTTGKGRKHIVSPWVKMIAGSIGGVIEAVACQPLDVAKTRMQLGGSPAGLTIFRTIAREEGVRALYKGLTPFCTHLFLKYALRLGSFGFFQDVMRREDGTSTIPRTLAAGVMAGSTEAVLIVTPFEVVKTRLQKQKGLTNLKYNGPADCVQKVVRQEGFRSLWKGVTPTVIRQGSNQGSSFLSVILLNKNLWGKVEGDGKVLGAHQTALSGLLAGAVGPCLNHPFDVAKSRMMSQESLGSQRKYTSTLQCLAKVRAEEGIAACYKGLSMRLARVAPGQAIMWTVVMRIQSLFEQRGINQKQQS